MIDTSSSISSAACEKYGYNQLANLARLSPADLALRAELQGDMLKYAGTFFKIMTGRDLIIPKPIGITGHVQRICEALDRVQRGECYRLMLLMPPRLGKTFLTTSFVSRSMSICPKCNFICASYGADLATKFTSKVRDIMSLDYYKNLFGVHLSKHTKAKDTFKTEDDGEIMASGTSGPILGNGAGIRGCHDYFSGAAIIDDGMNPDKVYISRKESNEWLDWYLNKFISRLNGKDFKTPIIMVTQRLGVNDPPSRILEVAEPGEWEVITMPIMDKDHTVSYYPEEYSVDSLLKIKKESKHFFYTQLMQEPLDQSESFFSPDDFYIKDEEPKIICSFITADTAETSKSYNDPTVFCFWGIYKLDNFDNKYGLHWIDCVEEWMEPKDLEGAFMSFYNSCARHYCKPSFAAIEKKSTGVTLISVLKSYQGLEIIDIERAPITIEMGKYKIIQKDKISRFATIQPFVAKRLISFTKYAKHINKCIEHMCAIKADGTQKHDDIADTLYDAIKLGLMDDFNHIMLKYIKSDVEKDDKRLINVMEASIYNDRIYTEAFFS